MKIAVYYNLEKGGALNYLIEIIKIYSVNHKIDIYTHQNNFPKIQNTKLYIYPLSATNNIFSHLKQIFFELKHVNHAIAQKINSNNYDLVIIGQCLLTQSPYLLKYLNKKTPNLYILHEPKREFYENTSYDYYSFKKIITRLIRLPIKYIDKNNCKYSENIISNSVYSSFIIKKIYKKKSYVVQPGLNYIIPKKLKIKNSNNFISIGLLSKIKGHDFSIKQLRLISKKFSIIGRDSLESNYITKLAKLNNIKLYKLKINSTKNKIQKIKEFTFYLANNVNEPYGITTLEATSNNLYVLGKNQGGTSEIIKTGLNGYLYPNDILIAQQTVKSYKNKKILNFYKICVINWKTTAIKIISIYNHIYNA